MAFFDNIHFPYFSFQELNLDWLLKEVKRIAGFMPEGGNVGDILTRKSDGAEWEVPQAVAVEINTLPEDTQILDNDQLIFYDISAQANRKIKPPNLMDSMCSNGTPLMNGTGSAGTSKKPARYDHVHPTDTSRQAALSGVQMNAVNSGAPANSFSSNKLKIDNGGTGAATAADARKNLGLCFAVNDTIEPSIQTILNGIMLTNKKEMFFDFVVDKSLENISTITVTKLIGRIRSSDGQNVNDSLYSSYNWLADPNITVTALKESNYHVRLSLVHATAFSNCLDNSPVVAMLNFELKFT